MSPSKRTAVLTKHPSSTRRVCSHPRKPERHPARNRECVSDSGLPWTQQATCLLGKEHRGKMREPNTNNKDAYLWQSWRSRLQGHSGLVMTPAGHFLPPPPHFPLEGEQHFLTFTASKAQDMTSFHVNDPWSAQVLNCFRSTWKGAQRSIQISLDPDLGILPKSGGGGGLSLFQAEDLSWLECPLLQSWALPEAKHQHKNIPTFDIQSVPIFIFWIFKMSQLSPK